MNTTTVTMTDRETKLQAYEAARNCVQPKNDKQENRLLLVSAKAQYSSIVLAWEEKEEEVPLRN